MLSSLIDSCLGKTAAEQIDPETAEKDRDIASKLDVHEYTDPLRNTMNQLKGQLGTLTATRGKKGNALKQVSRHPLVLLHVTAGFEYHYI